LVTLHRPSNVDDADMLPRLLRVLDEIGQRLPLFFPVHPRTRKRMADLGLKVDDKRLALVDPVGYLDFLALQKHARLIITDSGGIQEESTCLGVPCLTVRENTERPITVSVGTNILVGQDLGKLREEVGQILDGQGKVGGIPPLWDGRAGERIAQILVGSF